MVTVHSLRQAGHKVRVNHQRRYFDPVNKRWSFLTEYDRTMSALPNYVSVDAAGGVTLVQVTPKGSVVTFDAVAECSKKDAYNRKRGVAIALGRIKTQTDTQGITL